MNIYRNKKTGAIIEIPSEIGSDEVWAKVSSSEPVVPEEKEVKAPAKKTTRKVSK